MKILLATDGSETKAKFGPLWRLPKKTISDQGAVQCPQTIGFWPVSP